MDDHSRHHHDDRPTGYANLGRFLAGVGLLLVGICFVVLTLWMVTAQQNTKLYEADNVVCASQPFAMTCYERKTRP